MGTIKMVTLVSCNALLDRGFAGFQRAILGRDDEGLHWYLLLCLQNFGGRLGKGDHVSRMAL
jgi:hypothetical protein